MKKRKKVKGSERKRGRKTKKGEEERAKEIIITHAT